MKHQYLSLLRCVLIVSDLILFNFCLFITQQTVSPENAGFLTLYADTVAANVIWIIVTGVFGLYANYSFESVEKVYRSTWRSLFFHWILFSPALFLISEVSVWKFILIFYSLVTTGFLFSRFIATALYEYIERKLDKRKRVAILGTNDEGMKLAEYLEKQSNINFVGFLNQETLIISSNGKFVPNSSSRSRSAADWNVKEVYVALSPLRLQSMTDLILEAERQGVHLKFVAGGAEDYNTDDLETVGGFPKIRLKDKPLESHLSNLKKRAFDLVVALIVILGILSWLFPILAIWVKLDNPGPVLLRQRRKGKNSREFWCFKFRTTGSEEMAATKGRVTKSGRFLRRTGLDTLPQYINVILGSMSIVGPRPVMFKDAGKYQALLFKFGLEQLPKPGICGWAQINGFERDPADDWEMERRVLYDIWYLENWSAMLDLRIVFLTILRNFKAKEFKEEAQPEYLMP